MITKLLTNESFNFGTNVAARVVPAHSRGVDASFTKSASVFESVLPGVKSQPGKTIIHVIAVGDEEYFGPNRNCDGFSGEDNQTAHTSFKTDGHVFKNHQSDDPFKAVGDVIATAHNELMHRIELMLSLNNDKCSREIQSLESGGDIPVSMGSMQAYDVCSYCGHKAPTAADHCDHIRNKLGLIANDGRKIYMKNPKPKYFDISLVFKPADRVAYTLRKVAGDTPILGGHDLAAMVGLSHWTHPKFAIKKTIAEIYKTIPAVLRKTTKPGCLKAASVAELRKKAELHGIDHLVAFLSANGWLMGANDFADVCGLPGEACEQASDIFDNPAELVKDMTDVAAFDRPAAPDPIAVSDDTRQDLGESCSMEAGPTRSRLIRVSLVTPESRQAKIASTVDPVMLEGLGLLYGHYKIAFALDHQHRPDLLRSVAATW